MPLQRSYRPEASNIFTPLGLLTMKRHKCRAPRAITRHCLACSKKLSFPHFFCHNLPTTKNHGMATEIIELARGRDLEFSRGLEATEAVPDARIKSPGLA